MKRSHVYCTQITDAAQSCDCGAMKDYKPESSSDSESGDSEVSPMKFSNFVDPKEKVIPHFKDDLDTEVKKVS